MDKAVQKNRYPTVLIGHSLGCIAIAHWAQQRETDNTRKVIGALLVAPADVERDSALPELVPFAPIPRLTLPFTSLVVGSTNDYAASQDRTVSFALSWGAEVALLNNAGHINAEAGYEEWKSGFAWLYRLLQASETLDERENNSSCNRDVRMAI
ncbi:MAG: alpha/beta hydrolase [Saccharospirillum sp.]|nr:alpha/beta hydrolase [Saccharospirillum sp.]